MRSKQTNRVWNSPRRFLECAGLVLVAWLGIAGSLRAQPANDNFEAAAVLTGTWGMFSGSNVDATEQIPDEPIHYNIGGVSVWFRWTAPRDGAVYFHTFGSGFDTLLAAYTGTELAELVQVAANDDSFFYYYQFGLASYITFEAQAGVEYFIAVDGFVGGMGDYVLTWGQPSEAGVFDFTSNGYVVTETEEFGYAGRDNPRDVPGALITVNRTGGALGRVMVDYYVTNALVTNYIQTNIVTTNTSGGSVTNTAFITNVVNSAEPFEDYYPAYGTLTFDHLQTSTNFLVEVGYGGFLGGRTNTAVFVLVHLVNPRPALEENPDLVAPVIGLTNTARLDILQILDYRARFSFDRAVYRVSENDRTVWVTIVLPGAGGGSVILETISAGNDYTPYGYYYLQDGSDYAGDVDRVFANPPYTDGSPPQTNQADFVSYSQRINFGNDDTWREVALSINNDSEVEFNEDIHIRLRDPQNKGVFFNFSTITILYDDQPAGALDREWNPDDVTYTIPPFNLKPGANNEVFAVAVQDDQKTVIGGEFTAYNTVPRNRIARLNQDGSLDLAFNPGTGADGFVSAIATYPQTAFDTNHSGKILIAGGFSSINNIQRNGIARLNPNGSLDPGFSPGTGFDGVVRSLLLLGDGRVLAAGDFTTYNGVERRGVARLNSNGTLDLAFNPGTGTDGIVWAMGLDAVSQAIQIDAAQSGAGPAEYRTNINTLANSGVLTVVFAPECGPDRLTVYYGPIQIFDGGLTNEYLGDITCSVTNFVGPITYVIPYGPGPYTDLTLVVNEGSGGPGTVWSFTARIENAVVGERVFIGGDFTSVNGVPRNRVARLTANGNLDTGFDPGDGVNGPVFALAVQPDLKVVVGGRFDTVDFRARRCIARLNADGSLDTGFDPGEGANNPIYSLVLQKDWKPVIGGQFTTFDGVRRLGMARLFTNGILDTSFMDTAYNQFAGLINPLSFEPPNYINSIALQTNGDFMIGGSFTNLGGNAASEVVENSFYTPVYTRQDIRTRFNVARILGGYTPGPGNAALAFDAYTADENGINLSITLQRFDGRLGTLQATMSTVDRVALEGVDYLAITNTPVWPEYYYVAPRGVGYIGPSYAVLPLLDDEQVEGDETLDALISQPAASLHLGGGYGYYFNFNYNYYYYGYGSGEYIPLGGARGRFRTPVTIVDNDFHRGILAFSNAVFSVTENGLEATITVLRTNGSVGSVSVSYYTRDGTAVAGQDYTARSGLLNFASGETSKSFPVRILNDLAVEPDETVMLVLTNATGGAQLPGLSPTATEIATLNIVDDDFAPGRINLARADFPVSEGAGRAEVLVTRTGGSLGQVSVRLATSPGTALDGSDYIGVTTNLSWASGDTSLRYVYIPILDDLPAQIEPDETFNLTLSNPSLPGLIGQVGTATVTILNDDAYGNVAFSQSLYEADENGGVTALTVVRFGGSAGTVRVDYVISDGAGVTNAAVEGLDFFPGTGTLEFRPGETAKSFPLTLLDDHDQDGDKIVYVYLAGVVNGTLADPTEAFLTIVDNESFNAPAGALDTTFNALAGPNGDVFSLALQPDGRILVAGDFSRLNNITKNRVGRLWPDGSLDGLFSIGPGPNAPVRAMELQPDGKILLGGFFTTVHGTNRNHIARLNEDGTVDTFFNPGAGADNPVFDLVLTPSGGLLIGGAFTTFNGVSRPGVALLQPNGGLDQSFNPGVGANGTVHAVALQRDGKFLIGGEFTTVGNVPRNRIARLHPNGAIDLSFNPGSGANDVVRRVVVQPDGGILMGGSFTSVAGTARPYLARMRQDGALDSDFLQGQAGANGVVLDAVLQLDGKILVAGDFTRFNDVTRNRITRLYPNGETDPTINFGAGANAFIGALMVQPDRRIVVAGGFTEFNQLPRNRVARLHGGSIAGPGSVEFEFPYYTAVEDQAEVEITVRRVGGTTGDASILFTNLDLSATATLDYLPTNGVLVFPQGEVLQRFKIGIVDDTIVEPEESVLLLLSTNQSSGVTLGPQPVAALNIISDDSIVSFLTATFSASETAAGGFATISVARSGTTNTTITVDFTTRDGTARAGLDYTATSGSLAFLPGETLKTFTVPILNDTLVEGSETIVLTLANATGGATFGLFQATLQIVDDDFAAGMFNFSQAAYSVNEYETNILITVLRSSGSSGVASVQYDTRNGTAVGGQDYFPSAASLTFADGEVLKTFSIPIIPDFVQETNETLVLVLSNPSGGATLGPVSTAILTILNNALVNGSLNFSRADYTAAESNGTALITVTRSFGSLGAVSVEFRTVEGSALAGADYVTTNGTLSWPDGDFSARSFRVRIVDDSSVESSEQLGLSLLNPKGGATLGALPTATLIISDDDQAPGSIGFASAEFFVSEEATNALITVSRMLGNTGMVSIDVATVPGGTALPGTDYASNKTTLVFEDGQTTRIFLVRVYDNLVVEGNKTIQLALSNPGGGALTNGQVVAALLTVLENDQEAGSVDAGFGIVGANGPVHVIVLQTNNNRMLVAGDFTAFDGVPRNRVVRLNANGTIDTTFDIGGTFNRPVYALAVEGTGQILVGGAFSDTGVGGLKYLARLNSDGTIDTNFMGGGLGFDNQVNAVAVQTDGRLVIGGNFTSVHGSNRNHIVSFTPSGALDLNFNPLAGANGPVRSLALALDGGIYLGGDFTVVNGTFRGRIARLTSAGELDVSFNPGLGADDSVRAIVLQGDGKILIGGLFTTYNGVSRSRIARLNMNGTLDTSFNPGPGANEFVSAIALQPDGKVLAGGGFTDFAGVSRNRLARLNSNGSIDTTYNLGLGANNFISSIAVQPDRKILIGGGFTEFDGVARNFIARLNGGVNIGSGSLQFVSANFNVVEDGDAVTVTVRRETGLSNTVSVAFATSDGTAQAGLHYVPVSGTLDFAPGQAFASFEVEVLDDTVTNANRTINLTLSDPTSGATLGLPNRATVTVLNNDDLVGFAIDSFSVSEAAGLATIAVTRSGGSVGAITVSYSTAAGSALPGADYQEVNGTLAFADGQSLGYFDVPILDDLEAEPSETISLSLFGVSGSAMLGRTAATLTIVDDDFSPGTIGFTATAYAVSEQGTNAVINLLRTGGSSGPASVRFRTAPATATPGQDYLTVNESVAFAEGEVAKSVLVPILDDTLVEGDEVVNLTLANAVGAGLGQASAVLTLLADEAQFHFASNILFVVEDQTNILVEVIRSGGGTGPVSVDYLSAENTATADLDYTDVAGTLEFAPGQTNQFFLVPILDDFIGEGDELVVLALFNPVGEAVTAPPDVVDLVVQDDDVSFRFDQPNYLVSEVATSAVVNVVRVGLTNGAVSVRFATSDGTAVAGQDYVFTSELLTFADGELVRPVTIPILDDLLGEGNETINLNLFDPGTGTSVGDQGTAVMTIVDNEDSLSFSQAEFEVNEGASNALITILRQGTPARNITVNYTLSDGTATAGLDYTNGTGTLLFNAFEVVKTFSVPILEDSLAEGDETILLRLTSPSQGVTLVNPSNAVLVIRDNDISIQLSDDGYAVNEDATNALLSVRRIGSVTESVSVGYVSSDGTARAGLDYVGVSNVLTFFPGMTNRILSVPILDDLRIEGDETFLVDLFMSTNTTNNYFLTGPTRAVVSILDNDTSTMVPAGAALLAESSAPANGLIDPGEVVSINFGVRNIGNVDAVNLLATLQASNGVSQPNPTTLSYGSVIAGGPTVARAFSFRAGGTSGGSVIATLSLRNVDGLESNDLGSVSYTFFLGQASRSFTNTAGVTLNDNSAATPYPSLITVSNLPGQVARATVQLHNLSHGFPDDIDLLLQAPDGQNLILMSDAGGGGFNAINNVNLAFDDNAAAALPDSARINSGTYRPSNYSITNDPFLPPAPAGPFGVSLAALNGSSANGSWKLYAMDDNFMDGGNIAGGWSLTLTAADLIEPVADLSIQVVDAPDPILPGNLITYTIALTNHGPAAATGVVVTNQLPEGVLFVSATPAANCTETNGLVTCQLGALPHSSGTAFTIWARATVPGIVSDTAGLRGSQADLNPVNNLVAVKTTVSGTPSLSVSLQGELLIFSWPAIASGYVLQSTENLTAPAWTDVPETPTLEGDNYIVRLSLTGTRGFYRLRGP